MSRAKRTVLLIDHPVGKRDDRASRMLAERGYALDWRCPGRGDPLPVADNREHCAVIVYGGPESANDDTPYLRQELDWIEAWVGRSRPFLGICLGAQLLARTLGARVTRHCDGLHEIGYVPIAPAPASDGFLAGEMHVYHWHKEGFELPDGAELLAVGPTFPNQAYRYGDQAYGIQFHPEVTGQVMARWCAEAAHMLEAPGAQDAERQVAAAKRFDAPMERWLDGFFDLWLGAEPNPRGQE
jgi:GMP synthase (glutamine-hydrolysing)